MFNYIFFSAEPLGYIALPEDETGMCQINVGDSWSKGFPYKKLETLVNWIENKSVGILKLGKSKFPTEEFSMRLSEDTLISRLVMEDIARAYRAHIKGDIPKLGGIWPEKITSLNNELIGIPSAMTSKVKLFGETAMMISGWHFKLQLFSNIFMLHGDLGDTRILTELKKFIGIFKDKEKGEEVEMWSQRLGSTFVHATRGPKSWGTNERDDRADCVTITHGFADCLGRVALTLDELHKVYEHIDSHIDFIQEVSKGQRSNRSAKTTE
ncbi:hypothetical protein D5W64_12280 [Salmonella enterica subsp. enterica serovar Saintpaul]|nr:hypothetical protein [Salmonella enterica subsp. enterica serovar Saintpaul]